MDVPCSWSGTLVAGLAEWLDVSVTEVRGGSHFQTLEARGTRAVVAREEVRLRPREGGVAEEPQA